METTKTGGLAWALLPLTLLAAPALAQTVGLEAYHSKKCLAGGPGVRDCGPETALTIRTIGPGRVMLEGAGGNCLFHNRDGRFNWYTCNEAWNDQHWEWRRLGPTAEGPARNALQNWRMLRNVNSGKCLFSNSDGRFGVYDCESKFADQFWRIAAPAAISAFHSELCLQGGPGVGRCAPQSALELMAAPGADGGPHKVMIKNPRGNQCLYSNADGRFNWYNCNSAWSDQFWEPIAPPDAPGEVRGLSAGYRMLRASHSGKCLFSNKDKRFGVYDCNAKFTDQYWRLSGPGLEIQADAPEGAAKPPPEQPSAPPPPATLPLVAPAAAAVARDCGTTATDPGCNTMKDGALPMAGDAFKAGMAAIGAERNELVRKDLITTLFGKEKLTAQQFIAIIGTFNNELTRMDVVRELAPNMVDAKNAVSFAPKFRNGLVRKDYLEVISQ